MRNLALLGLRATVGGYVAVHGAQKLFGSFGGYGIQGTAGWYESIGLKPGKPMAIAAGVGELGGGVLTATGIASPLGPLAIAGVMVPAAATHLPKGPLSSNGGYELPVTNLAAALALAGLGPGVFRLGPRLSKRSTVLATVGIAAGAAFTVSKVLTAARESAFTAADVGAEPLASLDDAAEVIVEVVEIDGVTIEPVE